VIANQFEASSVTVDNTAGPNGGRILDAETLAAVQACVNHSRALVKLDDAVGMKLICDHFFFREILPTVLRNSADSENARSVSEVVAPPAPPTASE
jgi:hypothetical protein